MIDLLNLDENCRTFMVAELDRDIAAGTLYLSPRLNDFGRNRYPELLREAIESHDDTWLAEQLRSDGCFNTTEMRRTKTGTTTARIPVTAPETLAEGEFNRFYARGLCHVAIEGSLPTLTVYRAKHVSSPRIESERMIGKPIDPAALLNDLRTHPGMDTALHLPPGPNSGLSVCLS